MKKKNNSFTEGQELNYVGKGFLNFDKNNTKCTFISYDGARDAYVMYSGKKVLVYKYEIEAINETAD